MLTTEQIQERRSYVTGSDAATIMGVNPYESVIDLWRVKLGLADPKDLSDNPRVRAGNYLEPVVCRMFQDILGKEVVHLDRILKHPSNNFMAGNLDGLIPKENAILEIKTAAYGDGWGEQGEAIIPKHYLCQVMHYIAVAGASHAYVAVLIGGWDFRYYVIDRSEKLIEIMVNREQEFWDKNVLGLTEPEPRNYDDVVSVFRTKTVVDPIKAHTGIEDAIKKISIGRALIQREKEKEKKLKDTIALYMREHQTLMSMDNDNPIATFKYNKDGEKFDVKRFQKRHPKVYKKYLITTPGARVLRLKGIQDD